MKKTIFGKINTNRIIVFSIVFIFNPIMAWAGSADKSCDSSFIESYYQKKDCIINSDRDQCLQLGINALLKSSEDSNSSEIFLAQTIISSLGPLGYEISKQKNELQLLKGHIAEVAEIKKTIAILEAQLQETRTRKVAHYKIGNFETSEKLRVEQVDLEKKIYALEKSIDTLRIKFIQLTKTNPLLRSLFDIYRNSIGNSKATAELSTALSEKLSSEKSMGKLSRLAKGVGLVGGSIAVLTVDPAVSVAKQLYQNHFLEKCKSELNLSNDEVEFLSAIQFFSSGQIQYMGNEFFKKDCRKFIFHIDKNDLIDFVGRKKGSMRGLCSLLKNESKFFDQILERQKNRQMPSCDDNKTIQQNSSLFGLAKTTVYSYDSMLLPYDSVQNWPMSVPHERSKKADSILSDLTCIYIPSNESTAETNKDCINKQIYSCQNIKSPTCSFVSSAIKNRIFMTMKSALCVSTTDRTHSSQVKTKAD